MPQDFFPIGRVSDRKPGKKHRLSGERKSFLLVIGASWLLMACVGSAVSERRTDAACVVKYSHGDAFYAATEKLTSDSELVKAVCDSATEAPVCAFKTWEACFIWNEPSWCAAVGVKNVQMEPREVDVPPKPIEPWRIDLDDPAMTKEMGRVIGARIIEKDRCKVPSFFDASIDDYLGHTEVMSVTPDELSGAYIHRNSFITKRIGGRWLVTGWQTYLEAEGCVFDGYQDDPYSKAICSKHAAIATWALPAELSALAHE